MTRPPINLETKSIPPHVFYFTFHMAPPEDNKAKARLQANYVSPKTTHTFQHTLTASAKPNTVKEKTAYLSELRESVTKLQGEINTFLTQKMEEDKAAAAGADTTKRDEKEEEDYGEEVVEED